MSALSPEQRRDVYLLLLWLRRDLSARYAGSVGGLVWALLLPMATIAVFYVVFALVLQVRIPALAGQAGFFYYLLAGLLPWLAISEGLNRAAGALVAQEQFLQKIAFPLALLPVTAVLAGLVPQLIGTLAFIAWLIASGLLGPQALWWPLVFACQLSISLGAGLALSVVSVHVRDVLQIVALMLQILFYTAPIFYPKSLIDERYHWLFLLNPFSGLMEAYQASLLGLPVTASSLLSLAFWTVLLGGGGWLLFRALKPTLGDYL